MSRNSFGLLFRRRVLFYDFDDIASVTIALHYGATSSTIPKANQQETDRVKTASADVSKPMPGILVCDPITKIPRSGIL